MGRQCAKSKLCLLQLKEGTRTFTEHLPCAGHSPGSLRFRAFLQTLGAYPHLPHHHMVQVLLRGGHALSSPTLSPAPGARRPGPSSPLFQILVIILEELQCSDLGGWDKNPTFALLYQTAFRQKKSGCEKLWKLGRTLKSMSPWSSPSRDSRRTSLNIKFLRCSQPTCLTLSSGLPPCSLSSLQTSHPAGHYTQGANVASSSRSHLLWL